MQAAQTLLDLVSTVFIVAVLARAIICLAAEAWLSALVVAPIGGWRGPA